jgi:hypothetical protein
MFSQSGNSRHAQGNCASSLSDVFSHAGLSSEEEVSASDTRTLLANM